MTLPLSEHQQDALIETFNIGMGQAASCISRFAGEEIALSVPRLNVLRGADQADAIKTAIRSPRICAVSQDFTGSLDTRALLIFPEEQTQEIVRSMVGEAAGADGLSGMEQEALSEIGNIILNSCIGSLSETLQNDFHCSLPVCHRGSTDEILFANNVRGDDLL
ncbi:MAG TPA: chemotaxis protein CheX, partial [Gallionella sp.]|nr:chemotaxis protein CheX [Gallionella sp.]